MLFRKRSRRGLTERYVDTLSLGVGGYDPVPLPENLREAWGVEVEIGDQLDREALFSELQADLDEQARRGDPYGLSDRYGYLNWVPTQPALRSS
jgi:hypothetical protein